LFEGFGLPVLEGFQFGAPTLAANSTALPEVAGDAAILLAPEDAEAWATAMLDLSADPERRNGLISRGKRQARRFDWRNSARQLLDLYAEALATPKAPAGTAMTAVAP
jgi:alpha-1,3-rhamnosyl/mannosyltransferase